jgi:hypothetical protein
MAANGKGNGKKDKGGGADADRAEAPAPNGKAKRAPVAAANPPAEAAKEAEGPGAEEAAPAAREPEASAEAGPAPAVADHPPAPKGAAWGDPIARFEQRWTWFESRLITFVLVWQILALVAWVFLNGLSESVTTTAGSVFRGVLLAIALGWGAWYAGRKNPEERRRTMTLVAIAAAIGVAALWRSFASAGAGAALSLDRATAGYFDNVKGWLQEGSTLTLLGGLRGLGTRLTLWLALLGGSLATASGKHIHIDVVFRFLPRRARVPVSIVNYVVAAAVCLAGVWGFFDHIAIEAYGSRADDRAGAKMANALHHIGDHAFYTRKQIGLDLRSMPHVLGGQRYDHWMSATAWNEWVDGAGFEGRFAPEKVKNLHIPADYGTHPPFVVSPDGETMRSALAHTLGLVFPFGLLAIGLRFLLRALLTLSGHISADPDEAHKEELRVAGAPVEKGGA